MKNWRNVMILTGLALFGLWYGGTWAFQSLYHDPREKLQTEIEQYTQQISDNQATLQNQQQMTEKLKNYNYFQRSFPLPVETAQNLYHTWLLETVDYCQFEESSVTRGNVTYGNAYTMLPYSVRGRCSFDQLSRFLYEFYWVCYLHKIVSLEIHPVEQMDLVDVAIQINGIALPFVQGISPVNQLPTGVWSRLASGTLETYTEPINARNLLQFSRGGVDDSDFAQITGINRMNDEPEVWITIRSNQSVLRVHTGEQFRIGSFFGKLTEADEPDVVFETPSAGNRPPLRWLVSVGEYLKEAVALPSEY